MPPHKEPVLGRVIKWVVVASVKWAAASVIGVAASVAVSVIGVAARIDLREAAAVNSACIDGWAGRKGAGWACAAAAGADLVAASADLPAVAAEA